MGLLDRLKQGLAKTRQKIAAGFRSIDMCDVCGALLLPGDAIAGLCKTHPLRGRRGSKRLTGAETCT